MGVCEGGFLANDTLEARSRGMYSHLRLRTRTTVKDDLRSMLSPNHSVDRDVLDRITGTGPPTVTNGNPLTAPEDRSILNEDRTWVAKVCCLWTYRSYSPRMPMFSLQLSNCLFATHLSQFLIIFQATAIQNSRGMSEAEHQRER